jgi:hypothetical protein
MKRNSLLIALLLLATTFNLQAQEETYSPSVRPALPELIKDPEPRAFDVSVLEKSLITTNKRAQLFMRFSSDKLNGLSITFDATDGSHTVQKLVSNNLVLATLNVGKTYYVSYMGGSYILPDINTSVNSEEETLRITAEMLAALVTNLDYKAGKVTFIDAMDNARNVSYFEKLQVLQHHYLPEGVGIPEKLILDDNTVLAADVVFKKVGDLLFAARGKKTRGDDPVWPWDKALPEEGGQVDQNGQVVWPIGQKPCYATLLLKHSPDLSFYTGKTNALVPYNGVNFTKFYGLHAARAGAKQATVYEDYDLKGAAASVSLANDGWSNLISKGYDSSTYSNKDHYQSLIYSLQATDGLYYSKACGCQKRIKLTWKYNTEITAKAELKGWGGVNKSAGAHAKDVAVASIVSLDNGAVEIVDAQSLEVQRTCQKTLNPDWTKTMGDLVKDVVTVVGTIATNVSDKGDDPTKDADWLNAIASSFTSNSSNIAGMYTNLATLFTTPPTKVEDVCGSSTVSAILLNKSKDVYITPGQTFAFYLSSSQAMEVTGYKGWESATNVLSSGYITTYVYPKGTPFGTVATEKECCSRQMTEWLEMSLTPGQQTANLFSISTLANVLGYSWDSKFTVLGFPNAVHNWGAMFGARPSDCKIDIKIQGDGDRQAANALPVVPNDAYIARNNGFASLMVPQEFVGGTYQIYDATGQLVLTGHTQFVSNQLPMLTAPGLYIAQIANNQKKVQIKFYNE